MEEKKEVKDLKDQGSGFDPETVSVRVLIVAKSVKTLERTGQFLSRRGWPTRIVGDMQSTIQALVEETPDFVLVSVSHPSPKINKLPLMLQHTFNTTAIAFAEGADNPTRQKLDLIKCPLKMFDPPSGPAVHRKIKMILMERRGSKDEDGETKQGAAADGAKDDDFLKVTGRIKNSDGETSVKTIKSRTREVSAEERARQAKALKEMLESESADETPADEASAADRQTLDEAMPDEGSQYELDSISSNDQVSENNHEAGAADASGLGGVASTSERGKQTPGGSHQRKKRRSSLDSDAADQGLTSEDTGSSPAQELVEGSDLYKQQMAPVGEMMTGVQEAVDIGVADQLSASAAAQRPTDDSTSGETTHGSASPLPTFEGSAEGDDGMRKALVDANTETGRDRMETDSELVAAMKKMSENAEPKFRLNMIVEGWAFPVRCRTFSGALLMVTSAPEGIPSSMTQTLREELQRSLGPSARRIQLGEAFPVHFPEVRFFDWASRQTINAKTVKGQYEVGSMIVVDDHVDLDPTPHSERWMRVGLRALDDITPIRFDAFLPLPHNNREILYARKNFCLSEKQRRNLLSRGVDYLLIDASDAHAYRRYAVEKILNTDLAKHLHSKGLTIDSNSFRMSDNPDAVLDSNRKTRTG